MKPVQFDGSAAATLADRGISGLRSTRTSASTTTNFDIDRLHLISSSHHRLVPRHLYYECAHNLKARAAVALGTAQCLESISTSETRVADSKKLHDLHAQLLASAKVAKQLGYARRSALHHRAATLITKDYRPHFFLSLTATGFAVNLAWLAYLIKTTIDKHKTGKQISPRGTF